MCYVFVKWLLCQSFKNKKDSNSQQAITCTSAAAAFQLHLQRLEPSRINNICNNSEGVECGEEKGKEIYM